MENVEYMAYKWGDFDIHLSEPKPIPGTDRIKDIKDIIIHQDSVLRENKSIFLLEKQNKHIQVLGASATGLLGLGHNCPRADKFQCVSEETLFTQISVGDRHALAIDTESRIWAWGDNSHGQLGNGQEKDKNEPNEDNLVKDVPVECHIQHSLRFEQVWAVGDSSFALTKDGEVYSWGFNHDGLLGHGDKKNRSIPEKIESLNFVKKLVINSQIVECLEADEAPINEEQKITKKGRSKGKKSSQIQPVIKKSLKKVYQIVAIRRPEKSNASYGPINNPHEEMKTDLDSQGPQTPVPEQGLLGSFAQGGISTLKTAAASTLKSIGVASDDQFVKLKSYMTGLTRQRTVKDNQGQDQENAELLQSVTQVAQQWNTVLKFMTQLRKIHNDLTALDADIVGSCNYEENHMKGAVENFDRVNLNTSTAEITTISEELLEACDIIKNKDIEPDIKAKYESMIEMMNDAIALRKINLAAAKMKVYHLKMKDESFTSLQKFIKDSEISNIPNQVIRAKCKLRIVKTSRKLAANTENFIALHSGLTELSSNTMLYIIDAVATETDLWGIVNNSLANVAKTSKPDDYKSVHDRQVDQLWNIYNQINKTNIPKLIDTTKYSAEEHGSFNAYCTTLFDKIDESLDKIQKKLEKFATAKQEKPFKSVANNLMIALTENIELRKMLAAFGRRATETEHKN